MKSKKKYVLRYYNEKTNNNPWIIVGEKARIIKAKRRVKSKKCRDTININDELYDEYSSYEHIDCGISGLCSVCEDNKNNPKYYPEENCPEYISNMGFQRFLYWYNPLYAEEILHS